MILPNKIEIQIIDKIGQANPLANVILGLKVFSNNNAWYNYSVFKTNTDGHISLTRQQIIHNTELKHDGYFESDTPTRFELYVWDGTLIVDLIKTTKRLLELYDDNEFIRSDLSRHGIAEENIPTVIDSARAKYKEDATFFEQIKDAVNDKVQIYTAKIEDVWLDILPKKYRFTIEQT